jgi:hypothetical protein
MRCRKLAEHLSWAASGKATIRSPFSSGFAISENTSATATAAARNGSHSRLSVFLQAQAARERLLITHRVGCRDSRQVSLVIRLRSANQRGVDYG